MLIDVMLNMYMCCTCTRHHCLLSFTAAHPLWTGHCCFKLEQKMFLSLNRTDQASVICTNDVIVSINLSKKI